MSVEGPAWTRARLARVMSLKFGSAEDGGPDTARAAEAMGVSRRTVQRWLHAGHGRSLAHIPVRRREQLITLLLPDAGTLAKEEQQGRYARKAIEGLSLPRKMGTMPAWERQRWLEPHLIAVVEISVGPLKIRQLAIARNEPQRTAGIFKRGKVVDQTVVPTRFHATVLAQEALTDVRPWRFQAGVDQVQQGFTQAWMVETTTPRTHLTTSGILLDREVKGTSNDHQPRRRRPRRADA